MFQGGMGVLGEQGEYGLQEERFFSCRDGRCGGRDVARWRGGLLLGGGVMLAGEGGLVVSRKVFYCEGHWEGC